ncbi:hypothetical protein JHK86_004644 [Glycine max]|nr:hypothetical protein JHK86_004644 [Glycine max]
MSGNFCVKNISNTILCKKCWKLKVLILTQNNLSGYLPNEIGDCQAVFNVRISNNNLEGNIPKIESVGNLSSLAYFEASHNNLYGELCKNLGILDLSNIKMMDPEKGAGPTMVQMAQAQAQAEEMALILQHPPKQ